jgi:hypothetical protein
MAIIAFGLRSRRNFLFALGGARLSSSVPIILFGYLHGQVNKERCYQVGFRTARGSVGPKLARGRQVSCSSVHGVMAALGSDSMTTPSGCLCNLTQGERGKRWVLVGFGYPTEKREK